MMAEPLGTRRGSRKGQPCGAHGGPLAAPFNPTSLITGNGGFWRADVGVTQSSGNVTAWADQSSFANNLTGSNNPVWSATSFNTSFPGITFADNSSQTCNSAAINMASTTISFFMLINYKGSNTGNRYSALIVSANDFSTPAIENTDDGGGYRIYSSGVRGNGGSFFGLTNGNNYLIGFVANATNIGMWINGAAQGTATAFTSTLGAASTTIGVGAGISGATHITCAFVGWTQKAMNSTDWGNLKTWTNSNWGTSF